MRLIAIMETEGVKLEKLNNGGRTLTEIFFYDNDGNRRRS